MKPTLRPKQAQAKKNIYNAIRNGANRIFFLANPRFGKSVLMSDITSDAISKGKRVWIFAHTIELIEQLRGELHKFGIKSAVIMGQHPDQDYSAQVQVVSYQTITRRWDEELLLKWNYFKRNPEHLPDVAFFDEADMQYKARDELAKLKPDCIMCGVSGTNTAKGLGLFYKDLIVGSTIKEELDANNLVPLKAYSCYVPDLKGVKSNIKGDYLEKDLEERVNTKELRGNVVREWKRIGENRKTIVYATNCAHARDLARDFDSAGVKTALILGSMDKIERKQWIEEYRKSNIKVIVSVMTLTRGFNVVDIGCLIMARSTKSMALYIQMILRGMTKNDTHKDCIVLDFSSNLSRLGFPEDWTPPELCTGKKGENSDRKDPDEPLPKVCSKCGFLKPIKTPVCPNCGNEAEQQSEVTHTDEKLTEVKRPPAETRHKSHTKEHHQAMWSAFLQIANNRNHASHLYRDYYNVWPRGYNNDPHQTTEQAVEVAKKFKLAKSIAWRNRK